MSELKPCPHCGGQPYFSEVEEKDDRRYMQIELTCCATYTQAIGWGKYKSMSESEIKNYLTEGVTEQWNNRRIDSDELSAAQAREAELREKLAGCSQEFERICGKLDAADAKIKASQEQKPYGWADRKIALYSAPVIPPELAELQRENADIKEECTALRMGRDEAVRELALQKQEIELLNEIGDLLENYDYVGSYADAVRKLLQESKVR